MTDRRRALLIASNSFDDERLRKLVSPAQDVRDLADVLNNPEIGQYEVQTIVNGTAQDARKAINKFFADCKASDFLLLYVSSHGLKDELGHLYFAMKDTWLDELLATTVESEFIQRLSETCRARHQLFIFDSCFSGAFGKGWTPKDNQGINRDDVVGRLAHEFPSTNDRGLVVLTASTSFQYSFEGETLAKKSTSSVFTRHLIEGLRAGAADLDGDGLVGEHELYQYVFDRTRHDRPGQTPQRWVIGGLGMMHVALNPTVSKIRNELDGETPGKLKQDLKWQIALIISLFVAVLITIVVLILPPPPPPPNKVTLTTDTLFDRNKSNLRPEGKAKLDEIVDKIKQLDESTLEINIVGYTTEFKNDSESNNQEINTTYNRELSEKMAKSVADYLVSKGINQTRIKTEGRGLGLSFQQWLECQNLDNERKVIACLQPYRRAELTLTGAPIRAASH